MKKTINKTIIFKRCDTSKTLLDGIHGVKNEMEEKKLLTDKTTFEDMANYAGKHVLLIEKKEENL
jgi:hypothetical protein